MLFPLRRQSSRHLVVVSVASMGPWKPCGLGTVGQHSKSLPPQTTAGPARLTGWTEATCAPGVAWILHRLQAAAAGHGLTSRIQQPSASSSSGRSTRPSQVTSANGSLSKLLVLLRALKSLPTACGTCYLCQSPPCPEALAALTAPPGSEWLWAVPWLA